MKRPAIVRHARRNLAMVLVCACGVASLAHAAAPSEPVAASKTAKRSVARKKTKPTPAPVPPPPAPRAADPAHAAWTEARSLSDQGRHAQALAAIDRGLAASPGNTDLLWLQAAIVGNSGRNRDAVALYETLVAAHPELARKTRSDLATQRLWAGDAPGAVRDFELRIVEEPTDADARRMRALALSHADRLPESLAAYDTLIAAQPDDVDLRLERARVLSWMGRNADAAAAYRAILETNPTEPRAKLGLAQNENWSGHHHDAAVLFEDLLASGEKDPEITKGLAYAYYWDGRPDESRVALDRYLTAKPDDRDGLQLSRTLQSEGSPQLTAGYERSDDSDGLRVRSSVFEYRHPTAHRVTLIGRLRRDDVKDNFGDRDPLQVGGGIQRAWSQRWSAQILGYYLRPESGEGAEFTGEANLTHRPNQRLRIDLGLAREPVLTRIALENNVLMSTLIAGFDWQLAEKTSLSAAERLRSYNDGNRGTLTSAALRGWVITEPRWRLAMTIDAQYLTTRDDLDHGYYDPAQYGELAPGVALEYVPRTRWTLSVEGKVGRQKEKGADAELFHAVSAALDFPLGGAFGAHVSGGRSNSNLSSASGYKQARWAFSVTTRL